MGIEWSDQLTESVACGSSNHQVPIVGLILPFSFFFLVGFPLSSSAQFAMRQWDDVEWSEQAASLPPYPKKENLIPVHLLGARTFDFLIDSTSIAIGADGVVRYSIVARSPAGATNVYFEGIRCSTRERKLYAIGRATNSWGPVEGAGWLDFRGGGANAYHESLAKYYLCSDRFPISPESKIVERLKRQ